MQGQVQSASRMDAELAFKRFILEKTDDFEHEPDADLFRVNLLGHMLDRYDALCATGVAEQESIERVWRAFSDIPARMERAGFRRTRMPGEKDTRWPLMDEEDAESYIAQEKQYAKRIGWGAALCTVCVVPLFCSVGLGEAWGREDALTMFGLIGMFAMIGAGVYAFVTAVKPKDRERIRKRRFSLSARFREKLQRCRERVERETRRQTAKGIVLLTTCVIPLFGGILRGQALADETFSVMLGLSGMFAMIGAGVYKLVAGSGEEKAIKNLLKEKA